ncbi:UNVERIFIED_CONTAM: B3 domain-containing protein [Sesamum angustifolium]|uniref:B3 domain-containing protein n=1 Tax=Sesamum angustifolium TaxID=2727405 RepID=A0AAW2KVS5_9LAMI
MASSSRLSCFHCQDASSNPDHFRKRVAPPQRRACSALPSLRGREEEGSLFEWKHQAWLETVQEMEESISSVLCMRKADSVKPSIQMMMVGGIAKSCGKLVHCGCIVSFNTHLLLDFWRDNLHGGSSPKATVTPLFEKILSASDADLKLARLIIPKRCAEAFFPDISALHGLRIKIQDTEGNEWEFHYRYWLNGGSRIYVLEGLRDYMVSKNGSRVIQGITLRHAFRKYLRYSFVSSFVHVTFYRVDPGGKVVMGLRKTSADHQLTRHSIHFFPPESKENVYSRKRTTAAGNTVNMRFVGHQPKVMCIHTLMSY